MRRCILLATLALLAIVPIAAASAEGAASSDHVGLVIGFDVDRYIVITVPADEQGITGLGLLQTSGLEMVHDNGLVCKLGIVGCNAPEQPCICDMPNYWSYWLLDEAGWGHSGRGAGARILSPGDVDGWAWGSRGTAPPEVTVAAVFDTDRIAPRLPVSTAKGLQIAFQGDQNLNASVSAQAMTSAEPTMLPVERGNGMFIIGVQGLPAGRHNVSLSIHDPDGVNGMTDMAHEVLVAGTTRYHSFVPFVVSASSMAGSQRLPHIDHMLY